jgi:hypothetical protein
MKTSRPCLSTLTVVALAIGLFTAPAKAQADTYQFFDLGSTGHTISILGITASGTVVLDFHIPVGADPCKSSNICNEYETWVNGVMVGNSFTNPGLTYDNGTACTVSAPFFTSSFPGLGTCNNGHEVYNAGTAAMAPYTDATFTGPDPLTDLLAFAPISVDEVNLNSSGDFAYVISHPASGGIGEIVEAIDLTTDQVPEPSSIFLLGTGLLAAVGNMRRCLSQYKET